MSKASKQNETLPHIWKQVENLLITAQYSNQLPQLLNKLHNYQIEMELQNAGLCKPLVDLKVKNQYSRMQAAFQNSLDAIFVIDESGIILEANKSAENIFGYTYDEMIGNNVKLLMPEPYYSKHDAYLAHYRKTKEKKIIGQIREVIGKHKNGNLIPIELSISEAWETDHHFFVGTLRDITNKIKIRHQREQLLENLNLIKNSFGIGTWLWNLVTDELEWDERLYAIYGISKESNPIITYPIWCNALHPEDIQLNEEKVQLAIKNNSAYSNTFRIYRLNGELRWIHAVAHIIDDEKGQPLKMYGFNYDITEERQIQDMLREESHAAIAANEAKSRFLANMSHEIRTPMNGVIGMADLLRDTELSTDQKRMVDSIRYSSFSLLNIINDILDFSKIEAGKMSIEKIPMSLLKTVEGSIQSLWVEANRVGVDIFLDLDPAIPNLIYGDAMRIRQIILNLVNNATKFSTKLNQRGEVWVETRYLQGSNDSNYVEIIVKDNGIGMSKKQISQLFIPFSQADATTTRKFGGTGLGLIITKSLVEMMGGNISVSSKQDKGSIFTIQLPCRIVENDEKNSQKQFHVNGLGILLLMENKKLSRVFRSLIRYWRSKVWIVSSYSQAKRILTQAKKRNWMFDTVVIGPEFHLTDTIAQLSGYLNPDDRARLRYLKLTNNPSDITGMVLPNCLVIGSYPMKPTELMYGLAIIAGRESININNSELLIESDIVDITPPSLEEAERTGRLVLVAEDQPTNREVFRRQLRKLGLACTIVCDGLEALNEWKTGRYGLIITDCHMPEMDGFELTAKIRSIENKVNHNLRIPIIAITANALIGQAEDCLAAGMDDYLSKPVELKNLQITLERWLTPEIETKHDTKILEAVQKGKTEKKEANVIDLQFLSEILGTDNKEIIQSILKTYWTSAQQDWITLNEAFEKKDYQSLRDIVHAAKGAAHSAGATAFGDALQLLLNYTDMKNIPMISETYQKSSDEFVKLKIFFNSKGQDELT